MERTLGDERNVTKVERWMDGQSILGVFDFVDGEGQRWRQLTLSGGQTVQMLLTHPWLVLPST